MKSQLRNVKWMCWVVLLTSCNGQSQENKIKKTELAESKIAVVELFTSEGCSSCPPADKLLRAIQTESNNVYVISYHVDYWDRLGWKDPFSQSAFTERQRDYAQQFNLESVYTPQVVINGSQEFVGSDEQRLRSTLSQKNNVSTFDVKVQRKTASAVTFSYQTEQSEDALISFALVQPTAITEVNGGENNGRTLQHVNVVRQLTTKELKAGEAITEITIPSALQTETLKAILFIQRKKDKRITAVAGADIPTFMDVKVNDKSESILDWEIKISRTKHTI